MRQINSPTEISKGMRVRYQFNNFWLEGNASHLDDKFGWMITIDKVSRSSYEKHIGDGCCIVFGIGKIFSVNGLQLF